MPKYTDKEAIENYTLKTIDDSFDVQLDEWITAMSLYIDSYCNRNIFREDEETYKYDGDGSDLILIKDCIDISEVKIDDTVIDSTEYVTYPANKGYASRIKLNGWRFTCGNQNVSVTGIQAMNKVLPEDIKLACTVLVAGIVNAQLFNEKKGTTERIGSYSISYKDDKEVKDYADAQRILSAYKRIAL